MYTLDNETNDYKMIEIDGKIIYYFCDEKENFFFILNDIMSYLKLNNKITITLNVLNALDKHNINNVFRIDKGRFDTFITLEGILKILKLYPDNFIIQSIFNLQSKIIFPYYSRFKDSSEIDLSSNQKKEGKNWDE